VGEVLVENVVARLREFGLDPVTAVVVRLGGGDAEAESALFLQVGESPLGIEAVFPDLNRERSLLTPNGARV